MSEPGGSRAWSTLTGFSQGSAKAGAMLRVDFCHHSQTSLLIPQQRVVQTPLLPRPCLPFSGLAMHCLTPTFWPSITLPLSHTPLITLTSLLKMSCPPLPMKCLNEADISSSRTSLTTARVVKCSSVYSHRSCVCLYHCSHYYWDPFRFLYFPSPGCGHSYPPSSHQQKQHLAPRSHSSPSAGP